VAAYALEYPDEVTGTVCLAPIVLPELRLEHVLFGPRATPFGSDLLAATVGPLMDASLNPLLWRAMFLPQRMPERFAAAFPFDMAGKAGDMQALAEESIALIPDLLNRLARFESCPVATAVLTGDRDVVVNPIHGRMLARLLPNAFHRSLPGLGRIVHHFAASEVTDTVRQMRASVFRPNAEIAKPFRYESFHSREAKSRGLIPTSSRVPSSDCSLPFRSCRRPIGPPNVRQRAR
jgi:pimeloyl-ACP methyl ester carboxylesterase